MQPRSINHIEHRAPLTLATYEFPAPRTLEQNEVLLDIIRIDLANENPDERFVSPAIAVSALETKISTLTDHLASLDIRGEQDVAAAAIDNAEAIAGLLAVRDGITDPVKRVELRQQLTGWLERAELSIKYVQHDAPIHKEWDESISTIMSQNARFFSDPNQGMIPLKTIARRTVTLIDIDYRINRLKTILVDSSEDADLGLAFAGVFGEEQPPDARATDRANALFEYSTRLDNDQTSAKRTALENSIGILSSSFIDIDLEKDPLNFDQLKGLRIYGQALHDYAQLMPDQYSSTTISLRERSIHYLTIALAGLSAEIFELDGQTREEDDARQKISEAMVEFQRDSFQKKREIIATLYKRLFEMTLMEKGIKADIVRRGSDIEKLNIEEKELRHRLGEIEAGRPDPIQEEYINPDDQRPVSERIKSRLDGLIRTKPGILYDLNRIRALAYDHETEIINLRKTIETATAESAAELGVIIAEVRTKTDPHKQKLLSNKLGHIEHGNLAYNALENALDTVKQRDLADHFSIVYTGEFILIRDEVSRRQALAERAIYEETTLQHVA